MSLKLTIILLLYVLTIKIYAQDAHYWTEQYGTKSMLLSNSVVGSVSDLGAVFYNPARLGLIDQPAFLISAKVHQLTKTTLKNGAGDNRDLKNSEFGGVPSLVSGTFKVKWLPGHKFAYAFLTRNSSDAAFSTRVETYEDNISFLPGEEYFSGTIDLEKKFKEEWIGASWSKTINPNFSLGLSVFFTNRQQKSSLTERLQALSADDIVEMYSQQNSYSFKQYGLLSKLGVAYNSNIFMAGFTLTTPTVKLFGDGNTYYELFYTGYTEESPIYELNSQNSIDANYHTPWSAAIGFGLNILSGTLHLSSEYYSNINLYTLMSSEPFTAQSSGEIKRTSVINELNSVFNYGIGYNIDINENLGFYLSYSSDYSAAIEDFNLNEERANLTYLGSTFQSDVNHFAFGFLMDFDWASLTIGATNASANYTVDRPVNFPDSSGDSAINNEKTNVKWSRWRFIMGISIPFLNDVAKKLDLVSNN